MNARSNLLEVRGLEVVIDTPAGERVAVQNVDFEVARGEVLGLVGESGSGKSLSMLAVMGLLPPIMHATGSIRFAGQELLGASARTMRAVRGKRIAMVFQDPMTALNPVLTIGEQLAEALRLHDRSLSRRRLRERCVELLELVAIPAPEQRLSQYPHELSGGMRQRVVIAIAVANAPELLIADEPTTALDVTIQAQIVEIFASLRAKGLAILLITHDLGLVASLADRVTILYAGSIVERGEVGAIFAEPRHPYTAGLLGAVPSIDGRADRLVDIAGTPPSIHERIAGCRFHPRCPIALSVCAEREPAFDWSGDTMVACHRSAERVG